VIQPLEPGKVREIAVDNGVAVKAGDLLVAFDPSELQADERNYAEELSASEAEATRRRAVISVARNAQDATDLATPELPWSDSIPEATRFRQEAVMRADLNQLADTLNDLDQQIAEKSATIDKLNLSIAYRNKLIATPIDRVDLRNVGIKLNIDTKVNLFDAQESLEKSQSALASDQGQLVETNAAIKELASQKHKVTSQFVADNETKCADAERKAQDVAQQLAKAKAKLGRTQLFAPVDGVIQQLAVTTVGQVVTTGQQMMVIVPSSGLLQAEVYMDNAEIGFVKLGQEVVVKVDAFPFTRYGPLHGKVSRIASDAIDEQQARRAQSNVVNLANSETMPSANEPQKFVFPILIALDEGMIHIQDANVPLTAGMTVTAEIRTDSRRVIDYFFSPLARVASEALRER
jgi:hemolysin D